MIKKDSRNFLRKKRCVAIRKKNKGSKIKPRLSVYKGLKHIYTQIIDDYSGYTLVSVGTSDKDFKKLALKTKPVEQAKKLGELVAQKTLKKGIKEIVFDRSGYKFHGLVKAIASGAREKGLKF